MNKLYILYDVPLFYQSFSQGHFTYRTEPMTHAARTCDGIAIRPYQIMMVQSWRLQHRSTGCTLSSSIITNHVVRFTATGHKFRNADPIAPTLGGSGSGLGSQNRPLRYPISLPCSAESGLANGESCRGCQNKRSAGMAYFSCTREIHHFIPTY